MDLYVFGQKQSSKNAYLQDEEVLEDQIGQGAGDDVGEGEHKAPDNYQPPRVWQLHKIRDLKPCQIVDAEQHQQCLRSSSTQVD